MTMKKLFRIVLLILMLAMPVTGYATIADIPNYASFIGSGSKGPFSFNMTFFTNSQISVTKKSLAGVTSTLVQNVDYTISSSNQNDVGAWAGGSVTLTNVLATGTTLTITRTLPLSQTLLLPNNGPFYPTTIEAKFDYLTMIDQQLNTLIAAGIPGGNLGMTNVFTIENFADLETAVAYIGSIVSSLIVDTPQTLSNDLTIPSTLNLIVPRGGLITIPSGKTLVIDQLNAGLYQVFTGAGTVTVSGNTKKVYPEWWGCVADDSTDNTNCLQGSIDSLTLGGKVKISTGIYRFTNINISSANVTLEGDGWGSILATTMAANVDTLPAIWVKADRVTLKNFEATWVTIPTAGQFGTSMEENDTVAIGWTGVGTKIESPIVENIYVHGAKQHGISCGYSNNAKIINNRIEEIYGTGIFPYETNNILIQGNLIYRTSDAGIDLQCAVGTYADNAIIDGNIIQKTSIAIGSHGGRNVTISNNTIDDTWGNAISCQSSTYLGIPAPFQTNIIGNVIRRPFQFYGAGNFHTLDRYTTNSGNYSIIEVLSASEINISNNIAVDDSGLYTYFGISAEGSKLSIIGNDLTLGSVGFRIAADIATGYTLIPQLILANNNVSLANNHGGSVMVLGGIGQGIIMGNNFDCGFGSQGGNTGHIITAYWSKNVLYKGNNSTNGSVYEFIDIGNNSNITMYPADNQGLLYGTGFAYDTTSLVNKAHAVNTTGKYLGRKVWNTTTSRWVYARGSAVTDVWNFADDTLAHTPI